MSITVVVQQMVIIFILISIGMFLYKKEMLSELTSRQLSGLIVNLTAPALLICSALQDGPRMSLRELGAALMVTLAVYVILLVAGFLIPFILRVPDQYHYAYQMLTVFGNVGFIGIPLASAVLGPECLIFVSIYNLFFNLLIYTFGIALLQRAAKRQASGCERVSNNSASGVRGNVPGEQGPRGGNPAAGQTLVLETTEPGWKKMINAGTISAAVTIIISLGDFSAPVIVSSTLNYIGQTTTLFSMLVLGVSVAQMKLRDIFCHPKLYWFVLLRQILLPVGCVLLLRPFIQNRMLLHTMALMVAVPAGNMPLMLSKQLQIDTDTISQGIILTTVLGLVTIPIVSLAL